MAHGSGAFKIATACLAVVLAIPAAALAASSTTETSTTEETKVAIQADQEPALVWETDLDCVSCHTDEGDSLENEDCLASHHETVACTICHSDGDTLQEQHDNPGKRLPKRLKKTSVEDAACLGCHGTKEEGVTEALITATENCTLLTDENGLTVNPHDLPQNASHDSIDCVTCHKMHDEEADLENQAQLACLGCHHENVYECGTCHAH